ncbi:MAG: GNAT family N-acetyltransferase [Chloroflexota bacterium]
MERGRSPLAAADLLRQMVYLPQASIFVAEARRIVVGGAVLALRPSVRSGGYVGTVDHIVVDPEHDADRVEEALLEEVLRSAKNKGCTVVEADAPEDPAARARWDRLGFVDAGPHIHRSVVAASTAAGHS